MGEYNFVTEITSMVVEATDGYQGVEAPPEDDPFEGGPQLAFAAFAPVLRAGCGAPGSGGFGIQAFSARLPTSVPRNRNKLRPLSGRPRPTSGGFTTTTPSFTQFTTTTTTMTTTTTTTVFVPCKLIRYTSTRLRGE